MANKLLTVLPVLETATEGIDISGIISLVLPFAVVILVFYFMLIRPENKRKKSMQKMLSELKVGDEITTRGGVVGKITHIKDDRITITTGKDGASVEIMRWAISSKGASSVAAQ